MCKREEIDEQRIWNRAMQMKRTILQMSKSTQLGIIVTFRSLFLFWVVGGLILHFLAFCILSLLQKCIWRMSIHSTIPLCIHNNGDNYVFGAIKRGPTIGDDNRWHWARPIHLPVSPLSRMHPHFTGGYRASQPQPADRVHAQSSASCESSGSELLFLNGMGT